MTMIDILLATYNGARFLGEQLDSILNQTYQDFHVYIRDDGSSDRTLNVIDQYKRSNPKITLITDDKKCGSAVSNFMELTRHATSDYIMYCDQDDYWLPTKIEHSLEAMLSVEKEIGRDKPVIVFGSYKPVDSELRELPYDRSQTQEGAYLLNFSNLLVQNYVNGCLMMINRSLADKMGAYDKAILMHDWWATLIAEGCGGRIKHVNEVMMLYRQHGSNVVGSVNVKSFRYRMTKFLDPEVKKASAHYRSQAALLMRRNGEYLTDRHRRELDVFLELYQKKKIGRVITLIRGNYLKSDFIRRMGQIWYI